MMFMRAINRPWTKKVSHRSRDEDCRLTSNDIKRKYDQGIKNDVKGMHYHSASNANSCAVKERYCNIGKHVSDHSIGFYLP